MKLTAVLSELTIQNQIKLINILRQEGAEDYTSETYYLRFNEQEKHIKYDGRIINLNGKEQNHE